MANEDQPHNDHRLHIEPCLCGNPAPEVSGDDGDGAVDCRICYRETYGYGTRGAINLWNKAIAAHKAGEKEFVAHMPWWLSGVRDKAKEIESEADDIADFPHTAEAVAAMRECAAKVRSTVDETWKKIHANDTPFPGKSTENGL